MPIRDQQVIEDRIIQICGRVAEELDLNWLAITHKFNARTDVDQRAAEAVSMWEYRSVTIVWNLVLIANELDDGIEEIFIHEMVHALYAPVWDSLPNVKPHLEKLNEFCTEGITRVISAARRGKLPS